MRAADLVVRAAQEPLSRRGAFSISTVCPPTKPVTRAVGLPNRGCCLYGIEHDIIENVNH